MCEPVIVLLFAVRMCIKLFFILVCFNIALVWMVAFTQKNKFDLKMTLLYLYLKAFWNNDSAPLFREWTGKRSEMQLQTIKDKRLILVPKTLHNIGFHCLLVAVLFVICRHRFKYLNTVHYSQHGAASNKVTWITCIFADHFTI